MRSFECYVSDSSLTSASSLPAGRSGGSPMGWVSAQACYRQPRNLRRQIGGPWPTYRYPLVLDKRREDFALIENVSLGMTSQLQTARSSCHKTHRYFYTSQSFCRVSKTTQSGAARRIKIVKCPCSPARCIRTSTRPKVAVARSVEWLWSRKLSARPSPTLNTHVPCTRRSCATSPGIAPSVG